MNAMISTKKIKNYFLTEKGRLYFNLSKEKKEIEKDDFYFSSYFELKKEYYPEIEGNKIYELTDRFLFSPIKIYSEKTIMKCSFMVDLEEENRLVIIYGSIYLLVFVLNREENIIYANHICEYADLNRFCFYKNKIITQKEFSEGLFSIIRKIRDLNLIGGDYCEEISTNKERNIVFQPYRKRKR